METNSTVFATPTSFNYASFGARFLALFIDGLIIAIPIVIISLVLGMGAASAQPSTFTPSNFAALIAASSGLNLIILVLEILYFAYFESSSNQATLGKRAMGIKVVSVTGERITFANALGRNAFKILISGTICLIGYIMAAFTEKKQALHDMVASTLVVKS